MNENRSIVGSDSDIVQIDNVWKSFKTPVLCGISLNVQAGEWLILTGENGCGKSTLLSILAGALNQDKGTVRYRNGAGAGWTNDRRAAGVEYVPQGNPLLEELSVMDNIRLWANDRKSIRRELGQGVLMQLGLTDVRDKRVKHLSGGQKRRLSLATALINRPTVLILDEPTSALDLVCKTEIREYLTRYREAGGTIIMTSHDAEDFPSADRVGLMYSGTIGKIVVGSDGAGILDNMKANMRTAIT